jgi:AcrR family transcriptional regulator
MSRTANEKRPEELCDAIVQYLSKHGLADLSLRPLAKAVGSSPRVLLYYFGSKEKMVVQVLAEVRRRQRAIFEQIQAETFEEACRAIWKQLSAPDSLAMFRLYFEAFGIAMRQPIVYEDFLRSTVGDWVKLMAEELQREGTKKAHAQAFATVVLAGFRGFLLDYCASGDRARVNRAVELWLPTLDAMLRADKEA